jgi:DNA-binding NarL/FixJ family response regulator
MTAIISDSPSAARGLVTARERGAGPARGRAAEQQVVRDLLERAEQGAGGVLLADGEPGIGRSLLLGDAVDEAADRGFSLVTGAADELGEIIGCCPLATALGSQPRITELRDRLERRAASAPVLVSLDDLHWAGPATLAALRVLPRELKRQPIAWLLARSSSSRPDADRLFGLLEQDGATRLTLASLEPDTVTALLADAFGAPPDRALAGLAGGAAGNPALLTELIGGLRDERSVRVSGGHATLASARLPQRVHRLARRRLDGVGKQARHLVVTAGVLGPAFRLEDAAEMLGQTPAALLPAVEEAMDAAILTAADNAFAFRHQLLRRAIGETIPRPARQAVHRQYGEILLARGESPGQAASHLLQAAHPADHRSLAGLDQAAARTRRSAPQTAAGLAVRALELTSPTDPAAPSRAAAAAEALAASGQLDRSARIADDLLTRPLPGAAEGRVRAALASVLCARGQARAAADQARLVLDQPGLAGDLRDQALSVQLQALAGLGDDRAGPVADAVLADPGAHDGPAVAAALLARAGLAWVGGRPAEAVGLLRDAARSGAGITPDARQVQPLLALAAALIDLRQLDEAEDTLRAADHPELHGIPAQAGLSLLRARIGLAAGQLTEAAADARAALACAENLGADGYAATAHSVLSMIELRRGDLAAAAGHLASRPGLDPQLADLYARPETTFAQAQVTEAREGTAAALGHVRRLGADLAIRPGLLLGDPVAAAWLTRTALAAGDGELAARVTGTARALADAHPELPALAAASSHSQGLAGRDPAALARAAGQHPDPWARASAAEDLGVLHERQGDREQAIEHLKEALGGYGQAGASHDQARIRRRLRQLGIRRRHWTTSAARPVAGWDSLTDTEQAVAGLVAEGLNNSQVAARMYISTHTVAHHLRQSFRKLSIASRVELTRIVIEQAAGSS